MLPITASLVLFLASSEDGAADSHCDIGYNMPSYAVWRVDDDINDRIVFTDVGDVINNSEITSVVNTQLQNMARLSRGRFRARAQTDECVGPAACIRARSNQEDGGCYQGYTAYVTECESSGNCQIILCQDQINGSNIRWGSGRFDHIVAHELGHAYGLHHPHADTGLSAICNAAGWNSPRTPCLDGTSDACEGENMCAATVCGASMFVSDGDAVGLRKTYQGTGDTVQLRKVFMGAEASPISGQPDVLFPLSSLGTSSAFAPRIDCSELTSTTYQCVIVYDSSTAQAERPNLINVFALAGYTPSGWTTKVGAPLGFAEHTLPSDIAISDSGNYAWYVYTTPSPANRAFLVEINLAASPMTVTAFSLGFRAVLPPRVSYDSDIGQPLILGRAAVSGANESFNPVRWVLKARSPAEPSGIKTLDFSTLDEWDGPQQRRQVVADFDVDCRRTTGAADPCVVAVLRRQAEQPNIDGRLISSFWFSVNALFEVTLSLSWDDGSHYVQSVDGVALSPNRLFVSASLPIATGSESTNTRLLEMSGTTVGGTPVSATTAIGDAEGCSSQTFDGLSLPAFSMWGGYSIAWCPSCEAGGRLVSAHFGRRNDGNNFCF